MAIEAQTEEELRTLKEIIDFAQEWGRIHFNADQAEDPRIVDENFNFLPPSFFVEFPMPDCMNVTPSILGKKTWMTFEYRLHFKRYGVVTWEAKNPLTGHPLSPLIVITPRGDTF